MIEPPEDEAPILSEIDAILDRLESVDHVKATDKMRRPPSSGPNEPGVARRPPEAAAERPLTERSGQRIRPADASLDSRPSVPSAPPIAHPIEAGAASAVEAPRQSGAHTHVPRGQSSPVQTSPRADERPADDPRPSPSSLSALEPMARVSRAQHVAAPAASGGGAAAFDAAPPENASGVDAPQRHVRPPVLLLSLAVLAFGGLVAILLVRARAAESS